MIFNWTFILVDITTRGWLFTRLPHGNHSHWRPPFLFLLSILTVHLIILYMFQLLRSFLYWSSGSGCSSLPFLSARLLLGWFACFWFSSPSADSDFGFNNLRIRQRGYQRKYILVEARRNENVIDYIHTGSNNIWSCMATHVSCWRTCRLSQAGSLTCWRALFTLRFWLKVLLQ